jgi:mono/diheme cytochrome c family protein
MFLASAAVAALALADPRVASGRANTPPELRAAQDVEGRRLYLKNCRQCHGATGEPSSETKHKYPKVKSLNDATFLGTLSDDSILVVMKKGSGKDMKSFSDRLTPDEMNSVLKYVRTLPVKKAS